MFELELRGVYQEIVEIKTWLTRYFFNRNGTEPSILIENYLSFVAPSSSLAVNSLIHSGQTSSNFSWAIPSFSNSK